MLANSFRNPHSDKIKMVVTIEIHLLACGSEFSAFHREDLCIKGLNNSMGLEV